MGFRARNQDFEVNEGMVFLTKPGEVHGGIDTTLRPAEWFWIHIHFPENQALHGLTVLETREMQEAYARTSLCLFPGSDLLKDAFIRLLDEHRSPGEHGPLIARATLHELMVLLIRDHDRVNVKSASDAVSAEVRLALAWLDQNIGQPLSIPQLAAASGLSQSHFRQRFHKETGFTPSDYLSRRRVLRAKQILQNRQVPITEVAFRLGFQSSPYFAAVFRKFTGMTPSEYREQVHAEPEAL
jgi:AraC-like DNA-binding protein